MVKAASSMAMPKKRWPLLMLVALFSLSTVTVLFIRTSTSSDPCTHRLQHFAPPQPPIRSSLSQPSPLDFMKSKLVLMVSHELSLSGGPLLLMELAFLLRAVGSDVVWITNQMPPQPDDIIYSLENKMLDRGVQVLPARGEKAVDTALKADLVILNTAVAGKWLDAVLKDKVSKVLPKVLWWIHEMRGHYFKVEYVKHLPFVAGAMIDSHTTAEYWKNRTRERLGYVSTIGLKCLKLMLCILEIAKNLWKLQKIVWQRGFSVSMFDNLLE